MQQKKTVLNSNCTRNSYAIEVQKINWKDGRRTVLNVSFVKNIKKIPIEGTIQLCNFQVRD